MEIVCLGLKKKDFVFDGAQSRQEEVLNRSVAIDETWFYVYDIDHF